MSNYQLSINNYQLPNGYKQTEVGIIPDDWDVSPVGEFANIFVGKDVDEAHFSSIQDNKYKYPVYSNTVDNRGLYGYYDYAEFSGESLTVIGRGVGLGTAFSRNGGFGAIGRLVVIFPTEKGHHRFLADYINHRIKIFSESSGVPQLTGIGIAKYTVALPPKEEQEAIATALSDVDALIAALDKLIVKKRHLKTATMQQLLTGKKRLPGFDGKWTEKQIGSEIDLLTGYPFPSAKYFDSGIKLLRGSNIKRGVTDWSDDLVQYWLEVTADISQYVLNEGDIVIAMDGSLVGRSFARLSKHDLPALLLQRVARVRSDKINMGYLKEWICSKFFTEHCDAVKTVTAIPHISPGDIRSFTIQIPPTQEEQSAIATVLSDMDAEISALEARRAKTQAIKQGMMQELLTGRTRLV